MRLGGRGRGLPREEEPPDEGRPPHLHQCVIVTRLFDVLLLHVFLKDFATAKRSHRMKGDRPTCTSAVL